jgi:hypothetical protein
MKKIKLPQLKSKPRLDPAYEIVTRIDNLWNSRTLEYDSYLCGEPVMTTAKLERLVQTLKLMRSEAAAALTELEARLD